MRAIRALYDGHDIKPIEPVETKKKTEVIVIFPDEIGERVSPEDARRLLRGSGKGERLTEKLLKLRGEQRRIAKFILKYVYPVRNPLLNE